MVTKTKFEKYDQYLESVLSTIIEIRIYSRFMEELFYTGKNRVEIINEVAPNFFVYCERAFVDSIVMKISKLIDKNDDGKNINLSLEYFVYEFFEESDLSYKHVLEKIKALRERARSIKRTRNKKLAHLDSKSVDKVFPVSLRDIKESTDLLEEIFNLVVRKVPEGLQEHNPDTEYRTEPIITQGGTAWEVLFAMEKSRRFDVLLKEIPKEMLLEYAPKGYTDLPECRFGDDIVRYLDDEHSPV